jgi:hypothetical protein
VKFRAAPVSGFFLMHATVLGAPSYIEAQRNVFEMMNSSAGVNQHCVEALVHCFCFFLVLPWKSKAAGVRQASLTWWWHRSRAVGEGGAVAVHLRERVVRAHDHPDVLAAILPRQVANGARVPDGAAMRERRWHRFLASVWWYGALWPPPTLAEGPPSYYSLTPAMRTPLSD